MSLFLLVGIEYPEGHFPTSMGTIIIFARPHPHAIILPQSQIPGRSQVYMTSTIKAPERGEKIRIENGNLNVPDNAIIPFVEGDGTGRDIWRASKRVFDAAVEKAYQGTRKIVLLDVLS